MPRANVDTLTAGVEGLRDPRRVGGRRVLETLARGSGFCKRGTRWLVASFDPDVLGAETRVATSPPPD